MKDRYTILRNKILQDYQDSKVEGKTKRQAYIQALKCLRKIKTTIMPLNEFMKLRNLVRSRLYIEYFMEKENQNA